MDEEENATGIDAAKEVAESTTPMKSVDRKKRTARPFPAISFEECIVLANAIWDSASGQRVKRKTLLEYMGKSPDGSVARTLITASNQYGITSGGHSADYIELTEKGNEATNPDIRNEQKVVAIFTLAIYSNEFFQKLYDKFKNLKMPSRQVMIDFLAESGLEKDRQDECVDLFLVNAKYSGISKISAGADRIITIDQLLAEAKGNIVDKISASENSFIPDKQVASTGIEISDTKGTDSDNADDWEKICFFVSPIGDDGTLERKHSDLFLNSIVEPALEELGIRVVRADQINAAGMITAQIIEYIINSKLVIADLSFHNPNVFYELSLRHTIGKPTIHLIRQADKIPFDINSFRTIIIDDSDIYAFVPQMESYKTSVREQARRLIDDPDSTDNPIKAFLDKAKMKGGQK